MLVKILVFYMSNTSDNIGFSKLWKGSWALHHFRLKIQSLSEGLETVSLLTGWSYANYLPNKFGNICLNNGLLAGADNSHCPMPGASASLSRTSHSGFLISIETVKLATPNTMCWELVSFTVSIDISGFLVRNLIMDKLKSRSDKSFENLIFSPCLDYLGLKLEIFHMPNILSLHPKSVRFDSFKVLWLSNFLW